MKKYIIGASGLLAVLIIGGLIYIYSGIFNISALVPHDKLTLWVLNTVRDNSIEHNANNNIKVPNLNDSSLVKLGFVHYNEMCVGCHGGPGIERSEIGQGLYPKGPRLSRVVKNRTPQQLFWIVKNGLKMTGMPAFGPTHSDKKIWAITAFIEKLPALTYKQYQKLNYETKGESNN